VAENFDVAKSVNQILCDFICTCTQNVLCFFFKKRLLKWRSLYLAVWLAGIDSRCYELWFLLL